MTRIGTSQLTLDLEHRPALGRVDFMVSEANARAVGILDNWPGWPAGRMALIGPARAGKTHLAHVWMRESGAELCRAIELTIDKAEWLANRGRVVLEDADRLSRLTAGNRREAEDATFHLYNLLDARQGALLVTGRIPPSQWHTLTRDLGSRLGALPVVRIAPPDDALLSSVIVKLFADRQIQVEPGVIRYLIHRMDRSFEAAEDIVSRLDDVALARKVRVSRSLAAEILDRTTEQGSD